jgi:CRP-like cAMP-binding protein
MSGRAPPDSSTCNLRSAAFSIRAARLHAEDHRILPGQLTARERVAAFLLHMNNRIGVNGEIELPMSRTDVGDYLGLTVRPSREKSRNYRMREF